MSVLGRVPQVLVTLSPQGGLVAELPGANGSRRRVDLKHGDAAETLLRILHAQLASRVAIGEDGAPTQAQVRHWERHQIFADPRCPHCRAEGRGAEATSSRRRPTLISDHGGVTIRRLPPGAKAKPKRKVKVAAQTDRKVSELGL
jgi:hypothetical protein